MIRYMGNNNAHFKAPVRYISNNMIYCIKVAEVRGLRELPTVPPQSLLELGYHQGRWVGGSRAQRVTRGPTTDPTRPPLG